jgi:hypothetical protein
MEVSGKLYVPAAVSPEKELLAPIEYEDEWTPESVWTRWRKKEIPAATGNLIPVVYPVA